MTTWKQCIDYYEKVFDILQIYAQTHLKAVTDKTPLGNISSHILEKTHINLINCIDVLKRTEAHPLNFLSLGLILRGMLSDIINYRYLRQIYDVFGMDDFQREVEILDLDFASAYKRMVDNERKMAGGDEAKQKEIDETFRKNFAEFHIGTNFKKDADIRATDFSDKVKKFINDNGIELKSRIDTEAGKMQFTKDQHMERIQVLYTYLSQLQHFSGRSYNFYKTKEYVEFNPHLALMLLFFQTLVIVSIVKHFTPDTMLLSSLVKLAQEMANL